MAKSHGAPNKNGSLIRYLPCQAEPGMFRGEFLVYLDGYDSENSESRIRVQMLVDEREVAALKGTPKRNQPAAGWLKVTFAGKQKGLSKVILPQAAQPVGESMLVDTNVLRATPGG